MWKRLVIVSAALVVAAGCNVLDSREKSAKTAVPEDDAAMLARYYPLKPGGRWTYRVEAIDNIGRTNAYSSVNTIETFADGAAMARTVELDQFVFFHDLRLTANAVTDSVYPTGDRLVHPRFTVLRAPLEEGTTWMLSENTRTTIVDVDAQVEMPAGLFTDVVVLDKRLVGTELHIAVREFYAPNVGLIGYRITVNDTLRTTMNLVSFEIP